MMRASYRLLRAIILSALFYSSAFLLLAVPILPGILMLAALAMLWTVLRDISVNDSWTTIIRYGFVWGAVLFSLHFAWLPILLWTKSQAVGLLVVLLYCTVVVYCGLLSGLFFLVFKKTVYFVGFRRVLLFFWGWWFVTFIHRWFWLPLGIFEGYPFISPLIPLSKIPYFFSFIAIFLGPDVCKNLDTTTIGYIRPIKSEDPVTLSQHFFKSISHLQDQGKYLLVAPEGAYKFPLNYDVNAQKFLALAFTPETELITGGYVVENNAWYQGVYYFTNRGIEKYYVKRHLVPFVEKMPLLFSRMSCMRKMFLHGRNEFSVKGCKNSSDNVFVLKNDLLGIMYLCSEIFFTQREKFYREKSLFFFLVNDSWFVDYFRKIMETVSHMTAASLGEPVCYVNSQECVLLCPHGCRRVISS